MAPKNNGSDGGKRWPQDTKGKLVLGNYIVKTADKDLSVVADTVRLFDDGTLLLQRKGRPNLFAPGVWKALLMDQADE
jgi:hypothetical protein